MQNETTSDGHRKWMSLPPEITASILPRVGAISILTAAEKVCKSWREICRDPLTWRTIYIHDEQYEWDPHDSNKKNKTYYFVNLFREAVDRSCGQLVDISIEGFGTDDLLNYMTERSNGIKRLRLEYCRYITDEGMSAMARRLPMLEDLEISCCPLLDASIEVIGRSCPLLKSLKLNYRGLRWSLESYNNDARVISAMSSLQHLQIKGNTLTDEGLKEILDCCPRLQSLDLRHCRNLWIDEDLGERLVTKIKKLRLPCDSSPDFEYDVSSDDDDDDDSSSSYGLPDDSDMPSDQSDDDCYQCYDYYDQCYDYYDQTMNNTTVVMDIEDSDDDAMVDTSFYE